MSGSLDESDVISRPKMKAQRAKASAEVPGSSSSSFRNSTSFRNVSISFGERGTYMPGAATTSSTSSFASSSPPVAACAALFPVLFRTEYVRSSLCTVWRTPCTNTSYTVLHSASIAFSLSLSLGPAALPEVVVSSSSEPAKFLSCSEGSRRLCHSGTYSTYSGICSGMAPLPPPLPILSRSGIVRTTPDSPQVMRSPWTTKRDRRLWRALPLPNTAQSIWRSARWCAGFWDAWRSGYVWKRAHTRRSICPIRVSSTEPSWAAMAA